MDFIVVIFLIFILFGLRINKEPDNYLLSENTLGAKGILAITVVLHHLSQQTTGGILFPIFKSLGPAAVCVFFFYSGFGLLLSYKNKDNYLKTFFKKRFPTVLLPYIIAILVYYIVKSILYTSEPITLMFALKSMINGSPFVSFSWYVIAQCIFYVFFYISCKITKNIKLIPVLVFIFQSIYILACIKVGYKFCWYGSCLLFTIGVAWGALYEKLSVIIKKVWYLFIPIGLIAFIVSLQIQNNADYIQSILNEHSIGFIKVFLLSGIFETIFFCMFFIALGVKIKIVGKPLKFLGKISYEIYLYHGLTMLFFRNQIFNIENEPLYVILTLVSTLILSFILNKLNTLLLKPNRKMCIK